MAARAPGNDTDRALPPAPGRPLHALTVDVEDWFQSCIDYDAPITERVVRNVERVLAVLDECAVKATFFVQGRVAETFPKLVETVVAEGHEVQSHGYSHRPLFAMDESALREEVERARETVEAASGTPVTSFRAQDFSILEGNLWALDVIAEAGFTVDSSIFPMRTRRYGIAGWDVAPTWSRCPTAARCSRFLSRFSVADACGCRSPAAATSAFSRSRCSTAPCGRSAPPEGPPSSTATRTSSTRPSSRSSAARCRPACFARRPSAGDGSFPGSAACSALRPSVGSTTSSPRGA